MQTNATQVGFGWRILHVFKINSELLAIKLLSFKKKMVFHLLVPSRQNCRHGFKVIVRQRNVIKSSPAWDLFRTYFEYWVLHRYSSKGMWTRIGSHANEIIDRRINSGTNHNKLGRPPANITMSLNNELHMSRVGKKNNPEMIYLPFPLPSLIIIFYNFLEHWLFLFHLNQFIPK